MHTCTHAANAHAHARARACMQDRGISLMLDFSSLLLYHCLLYYFTTLLSYAGPGDLAGARLLGLLVTPAVRGQLARPAARGGHAAGQLLVHSW